VPTDRPDDRPPTTGADNGRAAGWAPSEPVGPPAQPPRSLPAPPPPATGWDGIRDGDPLGPTWRSTPLAADPLTSRSASDRMLSPPPEPGRTSSWSRRHADPATGSLPLDPTFADLPPARPTTSTAWSLSAPAPGRAPGAVSDGTAAPNGTDGTAALNGAAGTPGLNGTAGTDGADHGADHDGLGRSGPNPLPQRSRRRPPVIDLGATEGTNRTPFG